VHPGDNSQSRLHETIQRRRENPNAVSEFMNAEDLKRLGALTGEKLPTRKADLAQVIICHLEGERIRTLWQSLDEIQRAAVAEVVHSRSTQFPADRFSAHVRRKPSGSGASSGLSMMDARRASSR
jgi:hypothetical protein